MNDVTFVSFWTDEYEWPARRLRDSLDAHGLPHRIERRDIPGVWRDRIYQKPMIIREFLRDCAPGACICWLDADSVVMRYPAEVMDASTDVRCCRTRRGALHATLLLLRRCAPVEDLCDRWVALEKELGPRKKCVDQYSLTEALEQTGIAYDTFSESYNAFVGLETLHRLQGEPVIVATRWTKWGATL